MALRTFFGSYQVGIAADGTSAYTEIHGVQQVGITTNFPLDQVFEVGQSAIYELVENVPEVEITIEKAIDGWPLIYHLATQGAANGSLFGRGSRKSILAMSIFDDARESTSGNPLVEIVASGCVPSSVSYTIPVEGNCTESVTLVTNHKLERDVEGGATASFTGRFASNNDAPSGGHVMRRQHVVFDGPASGSPTTLDENNMTNAWVTILPTDIAGTTSSGTNPRNADGTFRVPVQSIGHSVDLGRDPIYELGRKTYYIRPTNPVNEVRTEYEVLATKGDHISATEAGGVNGAAAGYNLKNQTIRTVLQDGTRIDTGTRNKLQSVAIQGGDAGQNGSNQTLRYTYTTYNTLYVRHPADPSALN